MKIIVRRTAGIGDSLAATVVADLLHEQGHEVVWQCHPEVIPIIKRHPTIVRVEPPRGHCDVNLDGCYENHQSADCVHFHRIFMQSAAIQLARIGINRFLLDAPNPIPPPKLKREVVNEQAERSRFFPYSRPWVMIVPRSMFQTRCVPDSVWRDVIPLFKGKPYWLGEHPNPYDNYKCNNIEQVANMISVADLVVTVDTGPMHIASAYGIPMVVISQSHDVHLRLSPLSDFEVVRRDDLGCLNCQRHRCPIDPYNPPCGQIDPVKLADVVNRKLNSVFKLTQVATQC